MKKRNLFLLGLTVLALSACRGAAGDEDDFEREFVDFNNITISFSNPITGADGAHMRQLVSDFNRDYNGKIHVEEDYLDEVDFYSALELNMSSGLASDVALVHSYKVASYANRDLLHNIQPALDLGQVSLKDSDFLSSTIPSCYFNNKHYAIPLDIHTILLYYNKTLLDTYELAVPTNRQELLECCDYMANSNSQGWGLPLSVEWPSEFIFNTALFQNGGTDLKPNLDPNFNSAAGKTALKLLNEIIWDYGYSPTNLAVDGDLTLFCQNKAMFHIQGDWMQQMIVESSQQLGFEFGVTSLANMFTEEVSDTSDSVFAKSHVFIMPQKSSIDNVKEQAVLTFIKYIEEHSAIWAKSGHTPAYNAARNTTEYAQLPYHSHYGDLNDYRLNTNSPYWFEAYSPVYSRVTTAMKNRSYNADQLLSEAEEEGKDAVATAKSLE